jgi:beta-mannosidase
VRTTAGRQCSQAGANDQIERVDEHNLAASVNRVRWRFTIERPELWWPHSLGPQPLYRVEISVQAADRVSDRRVLTTGLRQVRVRNFVATVNGERLFLKGANCGPTRRALAEASCAELERDIALARAAGLDLLRVHAHITRPEFYEAADRHGMLIWQDLPLQWGYGQVRRQAVRQARRAVSSLGHHPSIALWCGHNEPLALEVTPNTAGTPRTMTRFIAGQLLPSWNKTALDRSIRRALERADGSREVVAHSGIFPHPAWGTDSHLYFGWYHGHERELSNALARFPVLARFVSEFGAQAVPDSAEFMGPERWPDLDWDQLQAHFALQLNIFEARVPPAQSPTFEAWRAATQAYQATLLRHHIETLRRLKYRPTGGFCLFLLADSQPAVSWSVLDHDRLPKAGYHAVTAACAPVIITAERPQPSYRPGERLLLDLHAVSDLRRPVSGAVARAVVRWPGGAKMWKFAGEVQPDTCVRIGRIDHTVPPETEPGPLAVELDLRWESGHASNAYLSEVAAPGIPGVPRRRGRPRARRRPTLP